MKQSQSIYIPAPEDGYELCQPTDDENFEVVNIRINGTTQQRNWTPIAVRIIDSDNGKKLLHSDAPWLGSHALIFSTAAIAAISPLLDEYGELLPLKSNGGTFKLFNPTKILDALDEEASSTTRFSDGRIMRISKYVFNLDVTDGVDIFKIPNLRVSPTFVSQRFVDLWNSAGLHGLRFNHCFNATT